MRTEGWSIRRPIRPEFLYAARWCATGWSEDPGRGGEIIIQAREMVEKLLAARDGLDVGSTKGGISIGHH